MYQNINKIYRAAVYVRLSKEDGDVSSSSKLESNSISNQKALILDFLKDKKDIEVVSVRVDDGYTGSNFERPAFQAMLEDIRHGVVDCVVVKDLSRFGREYIDSGKYIERLFPALGVRFIAINDNYDSLQGKSQSDEIIIPFKNLINDAYCRDISIKIRSNLEIKRKNGECVTPFVVYGYKKADLDRHKLEPDPVAGGVVQDIFKMKLQGMSQDAIANRLNELGVLSPFEYKVSNGSRYETGFRQKEQALWSSVTVRRILENEVYIGNLVQGKRTTPNHKVKQTYVKPMDDWIRIRKNHEPLVSERDFEVVQRLLGMDTRTSPDKAQVYLLSGIALCADCGAPMTRKVSTVGGKKYSYYLCSTNKETKRCSSHRIPEKDLENAVLLLLRQHIQNIMHLKKVIEFIGTVPFTEINVKKLNDRLEKKKEEVERCRELRMMLYTDMKEGIVSKEDYVELHAAYGKRVKNAEESIRVIQKEIDDAVGNEARSNSWIDYFAKYEDIKELTRTVIVELIREIKVYDKNQIEVVFDFDDCYHAVLAQLSDMGVNVKMDKEGNLEIKVKEAV
jgi:DNA invertase Pin-like site-specific DNA recombinase